MGELVVYTTDEVVARLKVSPRWFREFLKKHPYYREAGRAKLFTDVDIQRLYEAMTCPSSSSNRGRGKPRTTRYAGLTSDNTLTELQELLSSQRQGKSSRGLSGTSRR